MRNSSNDEAVRRYAVVETGALMVCCASALVGATLMTLARFDAVLGGLALGGIWMGTALSLRQIAAIVPTLQPRVAAIRKRSAVEAESTSASEWPVATSIARGAIAMFLLALMLAASRGFI